MHTKVGLRNAPAPQRPEWLVPARSSLSWMAQQQLTAQKLCLSLSTSGTWPLWPLGTLSFLTYKMVLIIPAFSLSELGRNMRIKC